MAVAETSIVYHVGLVLLLLFILNQFGLYHPFAFFIAFLYLYKVNERCSVRLWRRLQNEERKNASKQRLLSDSESVRWLNQTIEKVWPICMEQIASQQFLLPIIPWFLDKFKPWTAKKAVVQHLYLGRTPPMFTDIRVLRESNDDDHLLLELGLNFLAADDMSAVIAVKLRKRLGFGIWAKMHAKGMRVEGKIWDTLKNQVQAEFSDFKSASDDSELLFESKKGHLALDYKCMKWVQLESKKKKKKKHGNSLLVLGTSSGDVLAVEVSTGQLRWRVCDCHSGGVSAISFSRHNSFLFTAGLDGMVCQIDCSTGSVTRKFRSSTKGISTLAISADGNMLAVAAGLLKVFSCTDHNKIQKFSGHPVSVRCMIFGEDGRSILTSGVGERHIAIWKIDGTKKKGASCVLSMDHPAIFLDSRCSDKDGSELQGLYVLALSEIGVCYFWHGKNLEELQNVRATKISVTVESSPSKRSKNQTIFAAKLESMVKSGVGSVHVARGSLVKPSFEKLTVEHGVDLTLNTSKEGILLPVSQSFMSNKGQVVNAAAAVTALDSANAEDAILPIPRLHVNEKKRKHGTPYPASDFDTSKRKGSSSPKEVPMQRMEVDEPICIEGRLRAAGLLDGKEKLERKDFSNGFDDANLPRRKIRSQISKMRADDACKMLEILVQSWKTRSASSKHLLPWIYYVLVIHGQCIISLDSSSDVLHNLEKITRLKAEAASIHPLLKLSGRLQLIMSQIDKACWKPLSSDIKEDEVEDDEDEEEDDDDSDVDEVLYDEDYECDSDD